jgi:protoporphyrinogen oxidase
MSRKAYPVVIIGAGMAGLTCAHYLHQHGIPFVLLEKEKAVGGWVQTDQADGYLLDRSLQIFLTSYPEAKKVLHYDLLELRDFRQGAIIRHEGKFRVFPNPLREPMSVFQA